jgi:hypothetical protein
MKCSLRFAFQSTESKEDLQLERERERECGGVVGGVYDRERQRDKDRARKDAIFIFFFMCKCSQR